MPSVMRSCIWPMAAVIEGARFSGSQAGEAGFGGELDVDREAVRPAAGLLYEPGAGLGDGLEVDVAGSLAMISLSIHHKTTYRYRSPVAFGPHRLMLRPRESRELRLTGFELTVTPQASVKWAHDVWGNAVATTGFHTTGDTMAIDSVARIDLDAVAWPVFDIAASAIVYPVPLFRHRLDRPRRTNGAAVS